MSQSKPIPGGLYRFTSIARPVDPRYPTNRALLIVLPLLALASAGLAGIYELRGDPLSASLAALLTGFVAWALTRELAPDDDAAAFVALGLAWLLSVFFGASSVLLPFVALFLVRIVNRSTGLAARLLDTFAVLGFCIWAAITLEQATILLLAAAAFALDATLKDPLRHHFLAAFVCIVVFAWMLFDGAALVSDHLTSKDWLMLFALAVAILSVAKQTGEPVSVCDALPERLDALRVNAGLVVGFLLATQALLTNGHSEWLETPIWMCIVAVPITWVGRRIVRLKT